MLEENARAIVNALKNAGINFACGLPDDWLSLVHDIIRKDKDFTYAPVVNEASGYGICVGAWLGGKKPVLIIEASGLLVATEAAARFSSFRVPFLILLSYRGDLGDPELFGVAQGKNVPPVLEALDIPYVIIREPNEIEKIIKNSFVSAETWKVPFAVLVGGEIAR